MTCNQAADRLTALRFTGLLTCVRECETQVGDKEMRIAARPVE
jgi:hypothetical protein